MRWVKSTELCLRSLVRSQTNADMVTPHEALELSLQDHSPRSTSRRIV